MKIGIAVFSGTGNTAHVAGLLAEELRILGAAVDIRRIDKDCIDNLNAGRVVFNPSSYDLVGIGHPVLGFGPTPLVLQFAKALPKGPGRMFIFKSAADNHRINNSASENLIRILEDKDYEILHDFLYIMPCNWIFSYQRCFNLQIIDKAGARAVQHARELMKGTRSLMPVYRGWRRVARIFNYLETNYGRKHFSKSLRITKDCSGCGYCISECPVKNIREEGTEIRFGENCTWCMRCVYGCPEGAIDARWMKWCVIRGGYRLNDYLGISDDNRNFITSGSRGYWRHFQEYFL